MTTKNKNNSTKLIPPIKNITPLQRPPVIKTPIRQTPPTPINTPTQQNN